MYSYYIEMMECKYGFVHIYGIHNGDYIIDHYEIHGIDNCLNPENPFYNYPNLDTLNEFLKD